MCYKSVVKVDLLSLEGDEVEDSAEGEHEVEDPMEEENDELEEDDVVQFAIGDYAVVQGAFATGFSNPGRTWPGHVIRLVSRSLTWML